jgi:hypothetical protein
MVADTGAIMVVTTATIMEATMVGTIITEGIMAAIITAGATAAIIMAGITAAAIITVGIMGVTMAAATADITADRPTSV